MEKSATLPDPVVVARLREKLYAKIRAAKRKRVESGEGQKAVGSAEELLVKMTGSAGAKFRSGQKEVIESVLAGSDTFLLKACGGGKSATFYLSSALLGGVAVLLVPLNALRDHHRTMMANVGIRTITVSETGSADDKDIQHIANMKQGDHPTVVVIHPESLKCAALRDALCLAAKNRAISLLGADEARLLVEWAGFRESYRLWKAFVAQVRGSPGQRRAPLLGLDASISPRSMPRVLHAMGMVEPRLFASDVQRRDLCISCHQHGDGTQASKVSQALKVLERGRCIIFCSTQSRCERLAMDVQNKLDDEDPAIKITCYHAGLTGPFRESRLRRFMQVCLCVQHYHLLTHASSSVAL